MVIKFIFFAQIMNERCNACNEHSYCDKGDETKGEFIKKW